MHKRTHTDVKNTPLMCVCVRVRECREIKTFSMNVNIINYAFFIACVCARARAYVCVGKCVCGRECVCVFKIVLPLYNIFFGKKEKNRKTICQSKLQDYLCIECIMVNSSLVGRLACQTKKLPWIDLC